MAAMIHLAASIPELTLASDTHYPWLPDGADIIEGPKLKIEDGRMKVPDGPGPRVTLDPDKLGRAHEVYRKTGMRGSDDASLTRKLEPGWDGRLL
jgi:glucarate dehydratase